MQLQWHSLSVKSLEAGPSIPICVQQQHIIERLKVLIHARSSEASHDHNGMLL